MIIDEKRSELFDYLVCFQFLKEDPLEQNNSLFEKMLDPIYKTLREELLHPLKNNVSFSNRYANVQYNMFTYFFQTVDPESPEDYFFQFENASKETFMEMIGRMLSLSSNEISVKDIEQTNLSDEYKWAIHSFLCNFEYQKSVLLDFLKQHYQSFCKKRTSILQRVISQRDELLQRIKEGKQEIFLSLLPEETATTLLKQEKFFFLVSSPTLFYLYKKKEGSYLAIGCYLFPYLSMKERVQKEFIDRRKKYLKILADESRYGILQKLTEGITSNRILAEMFGLSAPGVSYQLNALTKSGIITYSKEKGKYLLNEAELQKVFSSILLDFGIPDNFL